MENRNGFTLVELLAVIAILAILVIIALPNVINMYNKAQKEIFLTEAKKVYSESEKKYLSNAISGNKTNVINSKDNSKLDMTGKKLQYCVILNNSGKVTDMKVSNGKWIASLDNNKSIEDLTIDDLEEGNLDDYNCTQNAPNVPKPIYCTFDGELTQGAEYVNGKYTYRYMQEGNASSTYDLDWINIAGEGWGVQLTNKLSTDSVTSKVCTYINNKPVISMSNMFYRSSVTALDLSSFNTSKVNNMSSMFYSSQATTLDLSSFDTSNVTNMSGMFGNTKFTSIDLSSFNTSNVTNMSYMFSDSQATTLDLSSFNTSKVTNMNFMFSNSQATNLDVSSFDTSNVTNMGSMFSNSQATNLDVSSFDTSNVTNMGSMFYNSQATRLDLSSFNTSNVTNMSYMFNNSSKLKTIYASNKYNTDAVTSSSSMFYNNTSLVGGAGSKYKSGYLDKTYARIDGGTTNPGYFTKK